VTLGFLLPAGLLLRLALTEGDAQFGARFVHAGEQQLRARRFDGGLCRSMLALLLAYAARQSKAGVRARLAQTLNRIVGLGYAVPGSVIAVGVLIPVTRLDNWLAGSGQSGSATIPGLFLTGGIAALIYAYLVRFLAVALQTVSASLAKVTPSMDDGGA
jgi:iron(III) transport system permease protein